MKTDNKKQKFHKGDHVQIAKDLGRMMSHFQSDCEAIVVGSYADQYGGNSTDSYSLYIKGSGESSWYYEHQIELIKANRLDMLDEWKDKVKKEADMKSDIDWIFSHGQDVVDKPHGASVAAIARCFGLTNLCGSNGEGVVYYNNAMFTMEIAKPFLTEGDKSGWLDFCKVAGVSDNE